MHKAARTIVLACIALLALFWGAVLIATWYVPHALFGWNLGSDGATLIYVPSGGPAARAGLRAGDRIDWSTLPLVGRANLGIVQAVRPSTRLHVNVTHGTVRRTVVIAPKPWPKLFEFGSHVLTLAGLFLTAIGIVLVQLRPSRMTWGFLLSSLLWAYPSYLPWLWGQSASWRFMLADGTSSVLTGAYAAGILIFMSRFPSDTPRGPLRVLDRCAIPLGVLVAALGLYVDATLVYLSSPPPVWALFANQSLVKLGLFGLALAALVTAYAGTKSSDRQRIIPVLIAFALYVASTVGHDIYSAFYTNPSVSASWYLVIAASMVALAIAVAYGVIRHRVLDVSFAISRTVVYTILTSIIVGVFVLIDFVSSKLLDRLQFAIILEAAAALALGVWLNALHSRIDRFVDRVFFRKRHLAQAHLERLANALAHAEDARFVDEALVVDPVDTLDLASSAVFRQTESGFARMHSIGWNTSNASRLSGSDRLVIHLRAELDAIGLSSVRWLRSDIPRALLQPLIAIPLTVRHDLLGFVLYSGHRGGEALDPDEIAHLKALANAAAGAYDHLETQALREENRRLRQERISLGTRIDAESTAG